MRRRLHYSNRVAAAPAAIAINALPDVCGLPVMTSSWKAVRSLDQAYKEVMRILLGTLPTFLLPTVHGEEVFLFIH